MMPIVGLFLAILGFSNVNLRFLAHFHELQRKTSLRMTHKNIKSSLRTISFLEPLKSSYFFGQFKPWRSYKLCSYKKKRIWTWHCLWCDWITWGWRKKRKKLKCQFFLCIFGQIPLQTKSAFLPTKEAFLEFFQENKSCLELNST